MERHWLNKQVWREGPKAEGLVWGKAEISKWIRPMQATTIIGLDWSITFNLFSGQRRIGKNVEPRECQDQNRITRWIIWQVLKWVEYRETGSSPYQKMTRKIDKTAVYLSVLFWRVSEIKDVEGHLEMSQDGPGPCILSPWQQLSILTQKPLRQAELSCPGWRCPSAPPSSYQSPCTLLVCASIYSCPPLPV